MKQGKYICNTCGGTKFVTLLSYPLKQMCDGCKAVGMAMNDIATYTLNEGGE